MWIGYIPDTVFLLNTKQFKQVASCRTDLNDTAGLYNLLQIIVVKMFTKSVHMAKTDKLMCHDRESQ